MLLTLLLASFTLISAQSSDAVERRFSQLREVEQLELISDFANELLASDNIVVHRAGELLNIEYRQQPWREQHALYVFDHSEYAPKLNLKYREYNSKQSKWKRIGRVALPDGVPKETPAWRYDYASSSLFEPQISYWGRALNSLHSGSYDDLTMFSARCEGMLNHDDDMAKIADYFAHTYRDRDGNVYLGIRLFDAWNAESKFGISDVEGIAFLRNVLDEHRIESPIDDRYHTKLYKRISEYFARWREYQMLRHTLASLQINPNAKIDLLFEGLRANLNMAWRMLQFDPRRMENYLKQHPTRAEFIAAISEDLQAVIQPQLNLPLPHNYQTNMLASHTAIAEIRLIVQDVLSKHGLLGLHR